MSVSAHPQASLLDSASHVDTFAASSARLRKVGRSCTQLEPRSVRSLPTPLAPAAPLLGRVRPQCPRIQETAVTLAISLILEHRSHTRPRTSMQLGRAAEAVARTAPASAQSAPGTAPASAPSSARSVVAALYSAPEGSELAQPKMLASTCFRCVSAFPTTTTIYRCVSGPHLSDLVKKSKNTQTIVATAKLHLFSRKQVQFTCCSDQSSRFLSLNLHRICLLALIHRRRSAASWSWL